MENLVTSCLSVLRQGVSGLDNPQSVMFSFLWVFSQKPRLCLLPAAADTNPPLLSRGRQARTGTGLLIVQAPIPQQIDVASISLQPSREQFSASLSSLLLHFLTALEFHLGIPRVCPLSAKHQLSSGLP